MTSDPAQETQRLSQVYAAMTSEELENVANDPASLTDEARETLKAEIRNRGLDVTVSEAPPGADVIEERQLVMIRRFQDLTEALLAKGSLASAGIECFLTDDNMVRTNWFLSNLLGGVKLLVNPEDAEVATSVLDEPIPETFYVEGVGEYRQPKCLGCQSLDVSFEHLDRGVAYTSASIGLPIPLHSKSWTCRSCGHHWEDPDSVETSDAEEP